MIGAVTALLRWPTAPPGYDIVLLNTVLYNFLLQLVMCIFVEVLSLKLDLNCFCSLHRMEMPVVKVRKHGVWLLAKNVIR